MVYISLLVQSGADSGADIDYTIAIAEKLP
jgi:hypothetical protein